MVLMTVYIWRRDGWPSFRWDAGRLLAPLGDARHRQGLFLGKMCEIGIDGQLEAELLALSEDVEKTSAIEGEILNPASVRSSIARRLGIPDAGLGYRFIGCYDKAIAAADAATDRVVAKAKFWSAQEGGALFPSANASCWTGSRVTSPPANGRASAAARRTRRCATSTILSLGACSPGIRVEAGTPAFRSSGLRDGNVGIRLADHGGR